MPVTSSSQAGPRPAAQRPTIRTVAERAGVSKSLVSLVLRGSPHVSEAKRQAVLDAMRELRYRPDATARALSEPHSRTVGVLVHDLHNPWYLDALDGIASVLSQAGLQMLLAVQRLDLVNGETFLPAMLEMKAAGIVLVGSLEPSAQVVEAAAEVPTVAVANRDPGLADADVVAGDDAAGTRLAVRHLVELGHRRLACLAVGTTGVGRVRRDAYEAAVAEAGLAPAPLVAVTDGDEDGGYRAAVRLLTGADRPTGLVCYNDIVALGALSAARDLGLEVPRDLSLVGYDNTQVAQLRSVALTTVDNSSFRLGSRAAAMLVERVDAPWRAPAFELVEPVLVVRSTTGPVTVGRSDR